MGIGKAPSIGVRRHEKVTSVKKKVKQITVFGLSNIFFLKVNPTQGNVCHVTISSGSNWPDVTLSRVKSN